MLFDFLFGKKRPPEAEAGRVSQLPMPAAGGQAPGTHIAYHPNLIDQLKTDHQKLLATFGHVLTTFKAGDLAGTAKLLEEFRGDIQGHLLTENVKLYIYLEHALRQDEESHRLVHGFRHEMDGIGKVVLAFLGKYRNIASQPDLVVSFGPELEQIGEALVARIKREEDTLYPLYLPAY